MRLLLPLLCGVVAAVATVVPLRAEGDMIILDKVIVEPVVLDTQVFKPVAVERPPATLAKEALVPDALAAAPVKDLVITTSRPAPSPEVLRGSVLMLLLPNLCCR